MTQVATNATDNDTFPRQYARTRRLTLGEPRNLVVSPDGQRIVFIRSRVRRRSGQLPLHARPRDGRRAVDRRSVDSARAARSRRRAARRTGASRAHARDGNGRHDLRDRLGCQRRRLSARRPPVRRRTDQRHGSRARGRRACLRSSARSCGQSAGLRVRTRAPNRRARRQQLGVGERRRSRCVVGVGRLHRGRRAPSLPRLLVEPRRRGDRRMPSQRVAGPALVHRRSSRPG